MKKILFLILILTHAGCVSFKELISKGLIHVEPDFLPEFHAMIDKDDIEAAKEFIAKKCESSQSEEHSFEKEECPDIHYKDLYNRTSLFYVKSLEMVEFLINKGTMIKVQDIYDRTPLHLAYSPEIAKFFLDNNLGIEDKGKNGHTPLLRAVLDKRIETARFLFQQGANPYAKTNSGWTPLGEAKENLKYSPEWKQLIKEFEAYSSPEKE